MNCKVTGKIFSVTKTDNGSVLLVLVPRPGSDNQDDITIFSKSQEFVVGDLYDGYVNAQITNKRGFEQK